MDEFYKYYAKQKSICHIKVQKLAELICGARSQDSGSLWEEEVTRGRTKGADNVLVLDLVILICSL